MGRTVLRIFGLLFGVILSFAVAALAFFALAPIINSLVALTVVSALILVLVSAGIA